MLRQRGLPLLPLGVGEGEQIAPVISTAISMCLPLPNFSLALPPLLMEELESRQVSPESEWDSGRRWPGWVEGECQRWGSSIEPEGTGLVLCMLFWDWGAEELDTSTKYGLSAALLCFCHWLCQME